MVRLGVVENDGAYGGLAKRHDRLLHLYAVRGYPTDV